jgi:hypothetical protein
LAKPGGLDILADHADIIRRADSADFTEEHWHAAVDTRLNPVIFLRHRVIAR